MFDKVDGFIWDFYETKYLALFDLEKYSYIYDRIRYIIELKSGIIYAVSPNYEKIKIDSDDDLPLQETLNLHNVIILSKSVFNKNQNQNYYNISS